MFATADVRDVLTDLFGADLFGASGSVHESDMPNTSTAAAVHSAVEAEQTRAE